MASLWEGILRTAHFFPTCDVADSSEDHASNPVVIYQGSAYVGVTRLLVVMVHKPCQIPSRARVNLKAALEIEDVVELLAHAERIVQPLAAVHLCGIDLMQSTTAQHSISRSIGQAVSNRKTYKSSEL